MFLSNFLPRLPVNEVNKFLIATLLYSFNQIRLQLFERHLCDSFINRHNGYLYFLWSLPESLVVIFK